MELKKISVGREHKQAFESICSLIDFGCFEELNIKRVGGAITDGVYVYEFLEDKEKEQSNTKHGFDEKGASWFKALRGESVQNDNAIWAEFIENVTAEYHKRYSVLEYTQKPKTKMQKEEERLEVLAAVKSIIDGFFPQMQDRFELKEAENVKTDIYGVSMRLEMSGGTGASVPVLGKVYFEKDGKKMSPVKATVSKRIDAGLKDVIVDDGEEDLGAVDGGVVDISLGALERLIDDKNGDFAEYLCFGSEEDENTVSSMLEKLSHDAVQLECQRVDVLNLSRLIYQTAVYHVIFNSKAAFKVTLGASKTLTVQCLNCEEAEPLIQDNVITVCEDGVKEEINIDLFADNLGLSEEQIERIKEYSNFARHFIKITCKDNPRNEGCTCWRCLSSTFEVDYNDNKMLKCKDCPYPEMVYFTKDGERKYTPSLVFAFDKREMIERTVDGEKATAKCSCCARTFSVDAIKGGLCPTCAAASALDRTSGAKKRYKDYKGALSLATRGAHLFSKKYCYEDDGIIIFVLGKKKYLLDKLDVKKNGYLKKPSKIN